MTATVRIRRFRARAGTVLFALTPEIVFAVSFLKDGASLSQFVREPEPSGMAVLILSVIHIVQLPLYCCLGAYWYGMRSRRTFVARAAWVALAVLAAVTAYVFFAVTHFPTWMKIVAVSLYLVSLLLLVNRDLWGNPGTTPDGRWARTNADSHW